MALLTRCLRLNWLQTANIAIGVSEIVGSTLGVAGGIFYLLPHEINNTDDDDEESQKWLRIIGYFLLFFFGTWLLMGIALLFGVMRNNKRIILFRIVITTVLLNLATIIEVIAAVVFIREYGFQGATAGGVVGGILVTGLLWFLWVVVYCFFKELNKETRNDAELQKFLIAK